ncbi:acyl-coenzyme A thioesterase 1-like [Oncorhynchus nerka]|uniref:acyl-coenzyme A thioesterase 1-like n=1 Tax=Oncorhynchus nerka TaxID=8023 RepID=UPI0011324EC5|nr:acyl-coenzyme A thioesterase 1-like [Oncorhynchus nerka]
MCQMGMIPVLTVKPWRALFDEKFHVVVGNLPPTQEVTLHSLHQSEDTDYWEAFGHYVSDAQGRVTVFKDPSLGGTYEGVEPMGLMWSMRPIPGSRPELRLRKKEVHTPMVVHISVYRGHMSQGFREQVALASVVTERWYMAPGVRRVDITEGGVTGTLFLPPGPGPFPGVLDMWGGSGGLVEYRAALLASHGFAAMALLYVFPDQNKNATIGYPYFEAAFRLLQDHPLVAADRIALLGLSLGVTVVLSITAYSEAVKPRCCVCISGSHACRIGATQSVEETSQGIHKKYAKARTDEENRIIWRDVLLPIPEDIDLKVEMGRITCPLLLVVGQDDQNWAAVESADDMKQMMERAGNSHLLTTLSYPGAGHLIEPPYGPHCRSCTFVLQPGQQRVVMLFGGLNKPHAVAQEDSWEKILGFLQEHLCHSVKPHVQSRL